ERNKYSKVDQAKILVDLINQRKRYFAAQKAKAKRNKPMTQAQRDAEEELDQGSSKRKKTGESSELAEAPRDKDANESFTLKSQECTRKSSGLVIIQREYPLSRGVLTQMLGAKLLMEQDNKMFRELLRKIFMQISDSKDEAELKPKIKKKTVKPSFAKIKPKAAVNAVLENRVNDVKASACWVWKPKTKVIDHVSKHNSASITLNKFDYVNAQGRSNGCSSHMTRSMSYLTDYEEIDEGYVAFGGNPKRGKITGKDKPKEVRKNFDPSLIKDWKSDSEDEAELKPNIEKKTVKPSFAKIKPKAVVNAVLGNRVNDVKASACWVWKPKTKVIEHVSKHNSASITLKKFDYVKAQGRSKSDKGVIDSGCSSHMTRSMSYLTDYDEIDEGYVPFGGNPKRGKITSKGIMRQYSVARTPQQNGVAERRNQTLIEAARTMLADSKLPTTFWAEAINTICYVQNRVLVVKPHNKIPYKLFHGRTPSLSFMRPFGCPVTILNTKDHLGKFDGNQSNGNAGTKACDDAGKARMKTLPGKDYILLPLWTVDPLISLESKSFQDDGF
nr:ribonuclease H-like domain-containing protein [Tanacetum cinerariifolium]